MQHTYIYNRKTHAHKVLPQAIAFYFLYLEQEHSNDEKKLLSLLQETQKERDDLLNQKVK
jgi:hypothetical protein